MPKKLLILILTTALWCAPAHVRKRRGHRRPKVLIMLATAFTHARHPTASGTAVHRGTVAADPRVLPLGTRIRVRGSRGYDGDYLVTDTGPDIKGMHIDIYIASPAAAKLFGKKTVEVAVLRMGSGPADARRKDAGEPD